jgi:chaperone required for assembly of F1-ATPase
MTNSAPGRRFYRDAIVAAVGDGFAVTLDGKPLRTPNRNELVAPNRALAEAMAAEWRAQPGKIEPRLLPLTRLANAAIDLVAARHASIVAETAKYAETDLVCYRAAHPPELVARQARNWQPLLDWAAERYGALTVTTGIQPLAQPAESLAAFAAAVARYRAMELIALRLATATSGSLVIALALIEERLDADAAFAAAELDESFQIENWGADSEQMKRRAGLKEDLALAARFAALLKE